MVMHNQASAGFPPAAGRRAFRAGFTMVELIVSIGVGAIVLMAMMMFFINSNRSYLNQDEIIVMNQNLRLAMDSLSRDVRMAGSGVGFFGKNARRVYISYDQSVGGGYNPSCYPSATGDHAAKASDGKYGIVPIDSCDGGPGGPDGIGLFGFLPYMASPLGATDGYSGQSSLVGRGWNDEFLDDFKVKDIHPLAVVVLVGNKPRVFVTSGVASTTSEPDGAYTFSLPISSTGALHRIYNTGDYGEGGPYGSSYNYYTYVMGDFFWLHYFIDASDGDNPRLMLWARHLGVEGQDEVVVANAIEDLQFRYIIDDDETKAYDALDDAAIDLDKNRVTAVKIALSARTERPSATGGRYLRPAIYNHSGADNDAFDGYRRQTLETTVYVRNAR